MWASIKKTVNSKLEKAIDKIIVDKVNNSYNNSDYIPLNKMLKGELTIIPNDKRYQDFSSSLPSVYTLDTKNLRTGYYNIYVYSIISIPVGSGNSTRTVQYTLYTRDYKGNFTNPIHTTQVTCNLLNADGNTYYTTNLYKYATSQVIKQGEPFVLELKSGLSNGFFSCNTTIYLGAEEKKVPYITIIDKDGEN